MIALALSAIITITALILMIFGHAILSNIYQCLNQTSTGRLLTALLYTQDHHTDALIGPLVTNQFPRVPVQKQTAE